MEQRGPPNSTNDFDLELDFQGHLKISFFWNPYFFDPGMG